MACWERVVGEFGNSQTSSAARVDDLAVDGEVDDDADDDVDTDAHAAVDVADDAAAGVDASGLSSNKTYMICI